jgi:putative ABC transport system substrate-binding protein
VVFGPVNDPVKAGLMTDLRHPGGNITGITLPKSAGLRLEWLAKTAPNAKHILAIYNANDPSAQATLSQAEAVLGRVNVALKHAPVANDDEITAMLANIPEEVDALFLARDSMLTSRINDIVAASLERKLPLSVPGYIQVRAGALSSYGFYHYEVGRNAAHLADQILRGANAGDLPVETADSFLFFNQKTAAQIGLEIPTDLLRQAKEIIRE